jgi:N-acetylmuramoyl-L-alanine amidase
MLVKFGDSVGMKFFSQNSSFFLHGAFARVSPVFAWTMALALALVLAPISLSAAESNAEPSATVKRQSAEAQFTRAEEQRAALTAKAVEKRSLAEYRNVVASYKKVYLITPHAADVQDSLLAVGELYTEMGDRFGRVYYQSAVESYQFLLREYPKSKFAPDVLLRTAKLQQNNLGDTSAAMKTYQDFLKRFPRSEHKREAQESLAELSLLQNSNVPEPKSAAVTTTAPPEKQAPVQVAKNDTHDEDDADDQTSRKSNGIPTIKTISATSTGDSTRITIALEDAVQYISGRIANPDRIYFDLHAAKLSPQLKRGGVKISGNLVSNIRVAQNPSGVVRIVLDLNGVKDYTASLLSKPSRLIIDLYATPQALKAAKPADAPSGAESAKANDDSSQTMVAAKNSDESETPVEAKPLPAPRKELPTAEPAVAKGKDARGKSAKNASSKPDLVKAPSVPTPTRDGQATLTRALGLKIGRIVIDAGHGGHDTGTIGPTGLMEKDLCLDVALRLGKIIQQKLPGADVVYTRPDDTFVPLEERTRIANEAKADLFISIHANSSHDGQARGIETYYLNLKGSAEAMEVAARENASSSDGIHDLEDIVKRIARTEKIDESKEFARDVQESLSRNVQKSNRLIKDRGVRKAPFVVLIGADMPSILTEISFLSNPSDEQMLKKPDQRQRVAEGIYQGVAGYLQSLNSMTLNLQPGLAPRRPPVVSAVEESRNQK